MKKTAFLGAFFLVFPFIILTWLEEVFSKGEMLFSFFGHLLSLVPGLPGSYLRSAFYYATLRKCAWNFHIGFGSFFPHRGTEIGSNVTIGAYCIIGIATIGAETIIASRCSIPSGKTQHFDNEGKMTRKFTPSRVVIGKNVWIGEGSIIMDDVGDDTIIGAGSVLAQKAPSSCLMAGVPARPRNSCSSSSHVI